MVSSSATEYARKYVERITFKGEYAGTGSVKSETVYRIKSDRIIILGHYLD